MEIYGTVSQLSGLYTNSIFSIAIYKILEGLICLILLPVIFRLINHFGRFYTRFLPILASLSVVLPALLYLLIEGGTLLLISEILFTLWMFFSIGILIFQREDIISQKIKKYCTLFVPFILLFLPFFLLDYFFPSWYQFRRFSNVSVALLFFYILWNVFHLFALSHYETKEGKGLPRQDIPGAYLEHFRITEREQDIIKMIIRGMTSKEVAFELQISPKTVKNHIYNIYKKTGIQSRVELLWILNQWK
ncbi:helix-turn-helix transcriptional regulator [Oceanispirochaeta sp.]|uniref:helix-turn-helix domain-containing protein n=1 Tax=Oceanispirochaeta sp. TaxID=2035350 RepID=UPI0026190316|nr:helix-turn-helix transcriptional regulator [Oceanispirochaeta sp.]MDA3956913.1 helix-turn-helix transcriptional regulator [Oceanispirochaeta sp.]